MTNDVAESHPLTRARDLLNAMWSVWGTPKSFATATVEPVDPDEASWWVPKEFAEAVMLCREAGLDREIGADLRRLGHAKQEEGEVEDATSYFEAAVVLARAGGDPLLLARTSRHLGDAHSTARRLAIAAACYTKALAIYAEHPDPPLLDHANAVRPMAILKEELGDTREARRLWRRARSLYAAVPLAAGVEECSENLTRLGWSAPGEAWPSSRRSRRQSAVSDRQELTGAQRSEERAAGGRPRFDALTRVRFRALAQRSSCASPGSTPFPVRVRRTTAPRLTGDPKQGHQASCNQSDAASMSDAAGTSRLERARDLLDAAWRLRGATIAAGATSADEAARNEEASRLVRRQLAEAVTLFREAGADRELTAALRRLGHAEQDSGDGEAATARFEEAVHAARPTGDSLLLAHAVRHLGDAHRAARRLAIADACYTEALALYAEHPDPPPLDHANAIRPMAILKEELGDIPEARRLWQHAKSLYAAVHIAAGVEECSENLTRLG